jgi:penicillin V acylase-like amidase (Ntn superfamily)
MLVLEAWQLVSPVHYATGKSIVIEHAEGKLNIHDNPLGVMRNSPMFDHRIGVLALFEKPLRSGDRLLANPERSHDRGSE